MAEICNGYVTRRRRPDGLSSSNLEAGVSPYSPSSPMGRRRPSYRMLGSSPSPRSPVSAARFFCEPRLEEEQHHFLDSCFLCKKHLGGHRDIFMYRGDTPFCSEECRQEQIDMDEAKENWSNLAMKASTRKEQKQQKASQNIHVRAAGTVVAG